MLETNPDINVAIIAPIAPYDGMRIKLAIILIITAIAGAGNVKFNFSALCYLRLAYSFHRMGN